MAIVTGVLVRIYRMLVLTHGSNNWLYLRRGVITVGLDLSARHADGASRATIRSTSISGARRRSRASRSAAEMATSALLIALGHEANGSVRAHWDDWAGMALNALLIRAVVIVLWGLILAGVVQARAPRGRRTRTKSQDRSSQRQAAALVLSQRGDRIESRRPPRGQHRRQRADHREQHAADTTSVVGSFGFTP